MTIVVVTIAVFAVVMLVMAIGVIVRGKCLSGSCGGPKVVGDDGKITCGTCGRQQQAPLVAIQDLESAGTHAGAAPEPTPGSGRGS
jgi:hypothetical protein